MLEPTEFSAVDTTGEQYSGYTLLVEAYAALWLVMMVWLFFIWRKQSDLTSRIAGLEDAIARAERRRAGADATKKGAAKAGDEEPKEKTKESTA